MSKKARKTALWRLGLARCLADSRSQKYFQIRRGAAVFTRTLRMPKKPPARYVVKRRLLEIQEQAKRLIETAEFALREIADVERVRVQKWRCSRCGCIQWFTKPVTLETCDPCPKCEGIKFAPAGEEPLPN